MAHTPRHFLLILCLGLGVLFSHGCATLPPRPDLAFESALEPPTHGAISDISEDFRKLRGSEVSGFSLLIDAQEAFEARLALVDQAVSSIDIQSFIWSGDATGTLFFSRLLEAADRGVKVRIIVDDIWLGTTTKDLAALNVHPNLEIRLFNPNPLRDDTIGAMLQFLASFQELNRRMHNKLMIVDNLALIGGGRNIGDPYFGLSKKYNFIDIDVLAFGAVIEEASSAFDTYWNHTAVYPISGWSDILPSNTMEEVKLAVSEALDSFLPLLSSYPIDHRDWSNWSDEVARTLLPGEAHFLQDDPVHIDGKSYRLVDMISYLKDPAEKEFILSTPYLIPVGAFLEVLQESVDEGIRVRILTNSLGSTNHTLVSSHYKKYRRPILETGTELHEFRHDPTTQAREFADVAPVEAAFISLHAKVFISDMRRCFIGSLNFDPRALVINSENGLLIDSPELAEELRQIVIEMMSTENAWHVSKDEAGRLRWDSAGSSVDRQPARNSWQRVSDFFGRFLPIEGQL